MSPVRKAILLGLLVVGADFLTKFYAVKKSLSSLHLNPDSLFFGLVRVPGFFDSLVVGLLLIIFIALYLKYWRSEETAAGFSLIIGGAIGNLIDGLADGFVVDFLDIGISTLNLADFAIMIGIALLIAQNAKRKV